ncbi:MAG TPA: BrnT family toxin [Terracidiphilus sp.]|nr:BrnT family toxin [Terracidiphilus sp.]
MARDELQFEWDEAKSNSNLKKHGVSFLTAAAIFLNETLQRVDDRGEYEELRFIALGRVDLDVYRVIFTWRDANLIRIISAQKAGRDEREIYFRETFS